MDDHWLTAWDDWWSEPVTEEWVYPTADPVDTVDYQGTIDWSVNEGATINDVAVFDPFDEPYVAADAQLQANAYKIATTTGKPAVVAQTASGSRVALPQNASASLLQQLGIAATSVFKRNGQNVQYIRQPNGTYRLTGSTATAGMSSMMPVLLLAGAAFFLMSNGDSK